MPLSAQMQALTCGPESSCGSDGLITCTVEVPDMSEKGKESRKDLFKREYVIK